MMTEGGQKSQKIDEVFYEWPHNIVSDLFIQKNPIVYLVRLKAIIYEANFSLFSFRHLYTFLLQSAPMLENQTLCKTFDWNLVKNYGKHCGNFATRTQSASHRP